MSQKRGHLVHFMAILKEMSPKLGHLERWGRGNEMKKTPTGKVGVGASKNDPIPIIPFLLGVVTGVVTGVGTGVVTTPGGSVYIVVRR